MVVLILANLIVTGTSVAQNTNYGPNRLRWSVEVWTRTLMHTHLINMTGELVKDAHYKLKHARNVQEEHRHGIGFELGTIAAGILERFVFMLKLYRKYSDLEDMKKSKYSVAELINILQVMQGTYNEITLEKEMFFKVLRVYEGMDPNQPEQDRMNRLQSRKPSLFKKKKFFFRRSGLWQPAEEQFDVAGTQ